MVKNGLMRMILMLGLYEEAGNAGDIFKMSIWSLLVSGRYSEKVFRYVQKNRSQ